MPSPVPAQRVLAVIPAWNEQQSVAATITEVRAVCSGLDILVVDDGSADRTAGGRRRRPVPLVCRLPFNLGVGGAMRAGFRYALRHGYDVVVQVDADGQHDPAYLAALVARLDRRRRRRSAPASPARATTPSAARAAGHAGCSP